jgi:hypothetical protein
LITASEIDVEDFSDVMDGDRRRFLFAMIATELFFSW